MAPPPGAKEGDRFIGAMQQLFHLIVYYMYELWRYLVYHLHPEIEESAVVPVVTNVNGPTSTSSALSGRKQEIIKLTEQLVGACTSGDYETYS